MENKQAGSDVADIGLSGYTQVPVAVVGGDFSFIVGMSIWRAVQVTVLSCSKAL